MNRRLTRAGWFCRLAPVALLWASQIPAADGEREATGNLPAGTAYIEQAPPGEPPALFPPGVLSASKYFDRLAFTPDGRECSFASDDAPYSTMKPLVTRLEIGAREAPAPAPLASGVEESGEPSVSRHRKRRAVTARFTGYVDQEPPGPTPRLFGLQTHERFFAADRIALSKDGRELYYTEVTNTWSDFRIRYYQYVDDRWNGPLDLFAGFLGPALSVDGDTMYFEKYGDRRTCWQSRRTGTGWGAPTVCTDLPDPEDKHYRQDTDSGRVYASSESALNGVGRMDISMSTNTGGRGAFQSLGRPLNSPGNEGDFYVSRDEAFIVFASPHRGGFGGADLFVSFREGDGSWSDPANLGATVNTPGFEFGPYVTDDKRFLFYSSSADLARVDVHWIRFDTLLETLRKR